MLAATIVGRLVADAVFDSSGHSTFTLSVRARYPGAPPEPVMVLVHLGAVGPLASHLKKEKRLAAIGSLALTAGGLELWASSVELFGGVRT